MSASSMPGASGLRAIVATIASPTSWVSAAALLSLAALSLRPALPGQQLPAGYESALRTLPSSAGQVTRVANGGLISFDGQQLTLRVPGQPSLTLLSFPSQVWGSFTAEVDSNHVLFGESSTDQLWLVPLSGPALPHPLCTLPLNYDAAVFAPGKMIVSAKAGGWASTTNELYLLDVNLGTTQTVASFPGASGPVAVAANGDLYYATASPLWPAPAGSVDIMRFTRATVDQAIQQNQVLGLAHATVIATSIDAASDMAFDNDGDLFFVDWWNSRVAELNDLHGNSPWLETALDYSTAAVGPSAVQFVPGSNANQFEPFLAHSGELLVHETAWGTTSQVRMLGAQAPTITLPAVSPIPTGAFALPITHGPANGLGFALVAFDAPPSPVQITVPGFEAALPWDLGFQNALLGALLPFDGAGAASFALVNPGTPAPLGFQVVVVTLDANLDALGSSTPAVFLLGQ